MKRLMSIMTTLVITALGNLSAGSSAEADIPYMPPPYAGPLLLLTPASNPQVGLPSTTVKQIAPNTKVVVSFGGFHVLLSETRSECFRKVCSAVFVLQEQNSSLVSQSILVDRNTIVRFETRMADTDDCYEGHAYYSGTSVSITANTATLEGSIGTASPCGDSKNYGPWRSDLERNPRLQVEIKERSPEYDLPTGFTDVRYQLGDERFIVNQSELLRRILREESAE